MASTHLHHHAPDSSREDDQAGPVGHMDHGHAGGHGDHAEMFRRKFWICLLLTLPTVLYSNMVQDWLNYSAPAIPGHQWVAPLFGTIVFLFGGLVFLQGGWSELKSRQPGMMLLISMGLLVAFGASVATQLNWLDVDLWFELATLVTVMLLGHWQEMKAIGQAQGALTALAELLPDEAERATGTGVETVPISALRPGDIVLVRPGGRVPADGEITEGAAELDESMVTGESRPVAKQAGDRVVAGTVATDSAIRVRVTAVGDDTALAGIQRLVAEAQASGSRAQALADRFAALLFYVASHRWIGDVHRLEPARRHRPGVRAHGHRARDRLPARSRPGHSTGDLAVDRGFVPSRNPRQGPLGVGAHALDRRGAVRQDRHVDHGPACGDRRGRDRPLQGRRPEVGGGGRSGLRAPAGQSDRDRRGGEWPRTPSHELPLLDRSRRGSRRRRRQLSGGRPGHVARGRPRDAGGAPPAGRGVERTRGRGPLPRRIECGGRGDRARGRGPPGIPSSDRRASRTRRARGHDHRRRQTSRRGGRRGARRR